MATCAKIGVALLARAGINVLSRVVVIELYKRYDFIAI